MRMRLASSVITWGYVLEVRSGCLVMALIPDLDAFSTRQQLAEELFRKDMTVMEFHETCIRVSIFVFQIYKDIYLQGRTES